MPTQLASCGLPRGRWSSENVPRLNPSLQIELLPRGRVFCRVLPVPGTSVSSAQHPDPYKELLRVVYDIHTRTLNFCKICTPVSQYPELLEVL